MGDFYSQLDEKLISFIKDQYIFFTASAASSGRVNLSPKGMDTLRIINEKTVAYLDLTGSGNETSAHIKHDGRLTIMVCGFASRAWIVRLYGRGEVILPGCEAFDALVPQFELYPGLRQIVMLHIESIQASCGYGVPKYEFVGRRDTLVKWAEKKGIEGIAQYQRQRNKVSIDGFLTHLRCSDKAG